MTSVINYPNDANKEMFPNNYSGVTIHVNNPAVNTMPNGQLVTAQPYYNGFAPMPSCNNIMQPQYMQSKNIGALNTHNGYAPTYDNNYLASNYNQLPQSYPAEYYMGNYTNNLKSNKYPQENSINKSEAIINELKNKIKEEQELEKNGQAKKIIALTNEYIMTAEKNLNEPDKEVRRSTAAEILTRLGEDPSRYNDAALNALLNKMLQDPDHVVKLAALSAFSEKLASGNEYTVTLLKNIQNNPNSDKNNVILATNILLTMSGETKIIYEPVKQNSSMQENA